MNYTSKGSLKSVDHTATQYDGICSFVGHLFTHDPKILSWVKILSFCTVLNIRSETKICNFYPEASLKCQPPSPPNP